MSDFKVLKKNIIELRQQITSLVEEADELKGKALNTKLLDLNTNSLEQKLREIRGKENELKKLVYAFQAIDNQQQEYIDNAKKYLNELNARVTSLEKTTAVLKRAPDIISELRKLSDCLSSDNDEAYNLCQEIKAFISKEPSWKKDIQKKIPDLFTRLDILLKECNIKDM